MEKLNSYLQQLLNTCGLELHLEPNKNPYILTASGQVDASSTPLPGAQINSMIFALIPNDIKQQLPNQPEVEFVHPHNLGNFSFFVKKSPSGFNVTIAPNASVEAPAEEEAASEEPEELACPEQPAEVVQPEIQMDSAAYSNDPESSSLDTMAPEFSLEDPVNEDVQALPDVQSGPESIESSESENSYQQDYDIQTIEIEAESDSSALETDFAQTADAVDPQTNDGQTPVQTNFASNTVPEQASTGYFEQREQTEPVPVQLPPAVLDAAEVNLIQPEPAAAIQKTFTPANPKDRAEMDGLFVKMAEVGASDLHLSVSMPPLVRKDGKMKELAPGSAELTSQSIETLLTSIMPDKNREEFSRRNDTDFAYQIEGLARFRANIFRDRKGMGGVFRIIPSDILTAEDLELSKAIMGLTELSKGLVVVTGPTGSGKSTTLCAMVDSINKTREDHIITIEDPIEFTHENIKCLVNQREVHNHTTSFKDALRAALREDPDILLVGEMRDLETISIAIETAETGHLVFGTLHTTTAASTIDRIIDQFPADRQQQIRVMLSESLKGVIAQTLLPKIGGGRIAALEVLIVTPAVANLIREGKTFQIPSQMQTGKNLGMMMLNDSLMELVNKGLVEPKDAYIKAVDKDGFETQLERNGKKL